MCYASIASLLQPCIAIHHHPFPFSLHLLRPHLQLSHHTDLLLALRLNSHHISLLTLILLIRYPPPFTRQSGRHECRAREHEADGAAVDAEAWEGLWEGVHELEVRDQRVVHVLPEERGRVEDVEGDAVRTKGCKAQGS